jgi:iron complex outermembrane receptor protein
MIAAKSSLTRAALKGGAATFVLAILATPFAVSAQTAAAAASNEEAAIIVTGSLIKNPNLVSAAPVNVTTADTIALKASNVAEEVLRDIPGIVPSIGSAVNNGNGGASYVDLRGIGSTRNIVLLDGNRIVPSGLAGRVDLNNIPLALVERVDALTGAAVTTYGADAISGVVNFVTKKDFTGVDLQLATGLTEKGDGQSVRADLTVGGNFDDGRGNAVLSVGYQKTDPIYQGARDFSITGLSSYTGGASGSGTTVPSRFTGVRPFVGGAISTLPQYFDTGMTRPGPIDPRTGNPNPATLPVFTSIVGGAANGGAKQIDLGTGFTGGTTFKADPNNPGQLLQINPTALYNFNPFNVFQTPFERFNIYAQAKYQVSDALEFYTRGMFSKNRVNTIVAPSGSFGSSVTIPLSNPYLPAGLRNQFCATNVAPSVNGYTVGPDGKPYAALGQTVYTPRFTPAECAAAATAVSKSDPNYREVKTNLSRRMPEFGPRISTFTSTVFDYHAGVRGAITSNINWDLSGSYGESENNQVLQGYVLTSRLRQSLLATNTTTCLDPSNGCIPINVFGPLGSIDPASKSFITAESSTRINTSLGQVKALISGDTGIKLGSATDGIGFAIGAEYRHYKASQRSDTLAKTPGELGGAGGAAPDIDGAYSVKEVYGELIAPLVQDKPFFENLTLEAGARYSSYKVTAPGNPSYDAFTWKVGGTWEVVRGFKVRGNFSHAVRAPNIGELFTPVTTGLTNLSIDPCAGSAPLASPNLKAVCLAQGAPLGQLGVINNPTAGQANLTSGGNINIKPEKANTWTIGTVIQPSFLPGFSFTADYYNIKVTDAISSPLPGDVIAACFGTLTAASITDPNCTTIKRNPVTGALDGDPATTQGLITATTNQGIIKTSGIDATANYSHDIGFAKLGITANFNYTLESKFQASPISLNRECVGYYSVNCSFTGSLQPKWQSSVRTTLGFDAFDVSVLWRHIDGLQEEPAQILADASADFPNGQPYFGSFAKIKAANYFDLTGRVSVLPNITLLMTVSNLFDRAPPVVGANAGSTSYNSGNTYPSTYDALGRRYTMQVSVRF